MVQQELVAHQARGYEQLGLPGVVRKGPNSRACPSPTFPDRCRTAGGTSAAPTPGTGHPRNGDRMRQAKTWAHKWARLGRDVGSWRLTLLWPCCGPGADMESWARGRWGEPQSLDRVSQSWWWPQRPQKRSRSYRISKSLLQDIFLKILWIPVWDYTCLIG